ncbi:ADP-ribosylglycohydrolase family protein [Halobaculum sp. D14]|uniref:ADP-ribosylglycohydrolase family protein n=1 Tax=unclassified Halobaculum TaxID=2640896 RepID=UPI003EBFDB14
MTDTETERRAAGCLLGLACGDALGRPVEFRTQSSVAAEHGRVTEMLGDGTHGQPAGTVTDDTELALCIARSLAENGGFDGADVARRFVDWLDGDPFDVGGMTADALGRIRDGADWRDAGDAVWADRPEGQNAGNGSLMRCAPYAVAFRSDRRRLAEAAAASSAITHADPRCVESCVALTAVVADLLSGAAPAAALGTALSLAADRDAPTEIRDALAAADDPAAVSLDNSGYVVHTLETALHDGLTADSAEDAIARAASRGGDADTVAAVAGAVAGARFGADALPPRWLNELGVEAELRSLAARLCELDAD